MKHGINETIHGKVSGKLFGTSAHHGFGLIIAEDFQGLDTFSENAMYAYLLKLLLLERRSAFNTEEGFKEYKELYNAILERAGAEFSSEMTEPGEPK